jgi:hypothetical protein
VSADGIDDEKRSFGSKMEEAREPIRLTICPVRSFSEVNVKGRLFLASLPKVTL